MKNFFLFLSSLLFVFSAFSQKRLPKKQFSKHFEYSISDPYKTRRSMMRNIFYIKKDNKILNINASKDYFSIQKLDLLKGKIENTEGYEDLHDNYRTEEVLKIQNRCYYFYSAWSGRKTKHERLFIREIDFDKGRFLDKQKLFIDHPGKLAYSPITFKSSYFGDKFDVLKSKDETKILIQYKKWTKNEKGKSDREKPQIYTAHVYNHDLTKIWSKTYTLPYINDDFDIIDSKVISNGDIYLLAKIYNNKDKKDRKRRKEFKNNYHVELFKITEESNKILTTKIEITDHFINDAILAENAENKIFCAGLYNIGLRDSVNVDGFFISNKFNLSNYNTKTFKIPSEVLNQYLESDPKKKVQKKEKQRNLRIRSLKLKDLIFNSDKSIILIGEQEPLAEDFFSPNSDRINTFYNRHNILISKIDKKSNISWIKKIPKKQSFGFQRKKGYSYLYSKGNHYIVFIDHVKNIKLNKNQAPINYPSGNEGDMIAYKINDESGTMAKQFILNTKKATNKFTLNKFMYDRLIQTSNNEFIFGLNIENTKGRSDLSGDTDVFVKVKIKD